LHEEMRGDKFDVQCTPTKTPTCTATPSPTPARR
jgi:hypothetical protein